MNQRTSTSKKAAKVENTEAKRGRKAPMALAAFTAAAAQIAEEEVAMDYDDFIPSHGYICT